MRRVRIEAGLVIFLLFFGTAMVDAVRRHAWATSIIYVLLGLLFLKTGSSREASEPGSSQEE